MDGVYACLSVDCLLLTSFIFFLLHSSVSCVNVSIFLFLFCIVLVKSAPKPTRSFSTSLVIEYQIANLTSRPYPLVLLAASTSVLSFLFLPWLVPELALPFPIPPDMLHSLRILSLSLSLTTAVHLFEFPAHLYCACSVDFQYGGRTGGHSTQQWR